jgi:hypothetical protein
MPRVAYVVNFVVIVDILPMTSDIPPMTSDNLPMTNLALRCIEKAEETLTEQYSKLMLQPSRSIVTLQIVKSVSSQRQKIAG